MSNRSRLRSLMALAFAISSLAVFAAPAAAETVLVPCSGTCGYWEVYDASVGKKGAVCVYANSYPYQLNSITVRPPLMHGYYTPKTKVGWRFIVQRKNVNGGAWSSRFTSSYQTALASDSIPANVGSGFSRRAWNAPANPAGYYYRILIEMQWWHNGSVEGFLRLKYDWYKRLSGNNTDTQPNYCLASF
jgi:hypothetical protein